MEAEGAGHDAAARWLNTLKPGKGLDGSAGCGPAVVGEVGDDNITTGGAFAAPAGSSVR